VSIRCQCNIQTITPPRATSKRPRVGGGIWAVIPERDRRSLFQRAQERKATDSFGADNLVCTVADSGICAGTFRPGFSVH
jgi:hypothetical protein